MLREPNDSLLRVQRWSERLRRSVGRLKILMIFLAAIGLTLAFNPVLAQDVGQSISLDEGFANPPREAKPSAYWLWLNGYVNRDYFETELREFADKGLGGLCVFDIGARGDERYFPPTGPAFLGAESVESIALATETAQRIGLDVQLAACSSWDLGGAWVRPEHASMALYRTELRVEGPRQIQERLPFPRLPESVPRKADGSPEYFQDVVVLAVPEEHRLDGHEFIIPDKSQILDLSETMRSDGLLRWSVPEGKWTIMRFACANTGERLKVPSPNSDGLATDHFSAEANRVFIQTVVERLQERMGNLREAGLKQLYLPSYEVVGATWTPDFLEQFEQYRNYDMTKYLPVFAGCIVESEEHSERFKYDFQKTLGQLLVDAYYRTASKTAGQAGLGVEAEAGGPGPPTHNVPVDALQALGAIDEMRGEFWPWRTERDGLWVVKETACAAHVYGHRRVHMEAFTSFFHWEEGPYFLKSSADRAFCEGMNHVVWHTSTHQPPEAGHPGWVYGAGTHLTPNLIWWPMARSFIEYLSRCSFMLQRGLFVGDVCYYYGDQGANFVPPKHVRPSLGFGYDYDVVNPEVILDRMSVENGRVTLPDGMQYELLVLPDREDIDLSVLRKLERLVQNGASILGRKPTRATGLTGYPGSDQAVQTIADRLWGDCDGHSITHCRFGEGHVYWGVAEREILQSRGIGPDFQFSSNDSECELDYIHRRDENADIYFVRNPRSEPTTANAEFRVGDRIPEFWFPETGQKRACHVYQQRGAVTSVPLSLSPQGSLFVVFRDGESSMHATEADADIEILGSIQGQLQALCKVPGTFNVKLSNGDERSIVIDELPEPLVLDQPWTLEFLSGRGAPDSMAISELRSWTSFDEPGIRYYSGIGRYRTSFAVPEAWFNDRRRVYLDLGDLWAVARVRINDDAPTILWKPPYRLEITELVRPGENRLEVEIANTWSNRLVGDALLPVEQRIGRTNITGSGTPRRPWRDVPLHRSGLFGPVRLIPAMIKEILTTDKP